MAVDLLGRGEGNAPAVDPVSSESSVAFSEVRWHRRGRSDDLIGEQLQRGGNPLDQGDRLNGCAEGSPGPPVAVADRCLCLLTMTSGAAFARCP